MCNNCFGNNSCLWIIILLILFCGCGNNSSYGNYGNNGCGCERESSCGCC